MDGTLYSPKEANGPFPSVIVAGAWTTVKEQMAGTYARELAARGFVALAFVSDYAEGKIVVDGSEIIEAVWFSIDELPQIPPKISIARQLIDWFTEL